jgi:hypothetical protein
MLVRREFLASAVGFAVGASLLESCSDKSRDRYDGVVAQTWRQTVDTPSDKTALLRDLVRYATLAPSSHNTQCWKFKLGDDYIAISPDYSRRCPVVDPDDHHLFVSLGCAAENAVQAAAANGLRSGVTFDNEAAAIRIDLSATSPQRSPLFDAIPLRQCVRADYYGKTVPLEYLARMEQTGRGSGVAVLLLFGRTRLEQILEYVTRGNSLQMGNPAFIAELKKWIRFDESDALSARDGLFSAASGNPAVPRWLGQRLMPLFFTPKKENDKYARQIRSSAGIAVFVSDSGGPARWTEVGRCYERFALQATALGLQTAMLNQPVEVSALRAQFADYLGIGSRRPDLIVRFGHGPGMPRSLRRPIDDVIIKSADVTSMDGRL